MFSIKMQSINSFIQETEMEWRNIPLHNLK